MDYHPFVSAAGWSSHQITPNGRRPSAFGHNRSISSLSGILRSASPRSSQLHQRRTSIGTSADLDPATPTTPQSIRVFSPTIDDENDMSTIPDPRSRAMSPANLDAMTSPHHPDLDQEVATLSTKLINAINHQTTLDDNLSATRMELENALETIRQLERQVEDQREMLSGDVWIRRKTAEAEKTTVLARLAEEKRARLDMEQQKKKIEQELENLTAALFEEANKMVITAKEEARMEQDVLHRKNDQIRAQLADTEGLLKSQQEQLAELKHVLEMMTAEKEEQFPPTVPSSPGFSRFDVREELSPSAGTHHSGPLEPLSPSHPTSFTHLLQPVLRTDLASYNDFKDLIRTSKRLSASRGPPASSASGLTTLGLSLGSASSQPPQTNGSNSSVSTAGTPPASSPHTPMTPTSNLSASSPAGAPIFPHLKETKFYKRVLTEDVEPTLRLDTAPGLSWLARRSVLTAMTDGSLVVEPIPATSTGRFGKIIKPELYPCSLCGEARKDDEYLRTHRFRTSESGSAQSGYPLCRYCLARVRSTCDFLGFLRIVKDGHWRAEDEDAEKAAWEESVRLREQMFWSRIGGGVVPTSPLQPTVPSPVPSPRPSHDELKQAEPVDVTEHAAEGHHVLGGAKLDTNHAGPGETLPAPKNLDFEVLVTTEVAEVATVAVAAAVAPAVDVPKVVEPEQQTTKHTSIPSAMPSLTSTPSSESDEVRRLSLTIPGSFD